MFTVKSGYNLTANFVEDAGKLYSFDTNYNDEYATETAINCNKILEIAFRITTRHLNVLITDLSFTYLKNLSTPSSEKKRKFKKNFKCLGNLDSVTMSELFRGLCYLTGRKNYKIIS